MFLKTTKFNHEADSFNVALGISEETMTIVREMVFFSTIANKYQRDELYGEEDYPPGMDKVSGDLQRCVGLIKTEEQYTQLLLNFRSYQNIAIQTVAIREVMDGKIENDDDPEFSKKVKTLKMVEQIISKLKDEEEVKHDINDINKDTMFKRIDLVRKSEYNFDIYWSLLNASFNMDSVDQIINDALFGND